MTSAVRCCKCMFYERFGGDLPGERELAECHRHAPHPIIDGTDAFRYEMEDEHGGQNRYSHIWPLVEDYEWCGEFKRGSRDDLDVNSATREGVKSGEENG